jgi:hypothetical protein
VCRRDEERERERKVLVPGLVEQRPTGIMNKEGIGQWTHEGTMVNG